MQCGFGANLGLRYKVLNKDIQLRGKLHYCATAVLTTVIYMQSEKRQS